MLYEEQYRQAVLHDSVAVYQVNITRDRIDEEFAQYPDDGSTDMLMAVALKAPCSYNEYCLRWERRVSEETMSAYFRLNTCAKLLQLFECGVTSVSVEYCTKDVRNRNVWVSKNVQMFRDGASQSVYGLVCIKDITRQYEQEMASREYERKATLDLLTGIKNHVSGEMMIRERLLAHPELEYMLLLFDVDRFKTVNDIYGHQFGDEVLKNTASLLQEACRMKDIAVRVGGDEFVLFMELPEQKNQVVERIFNKLCYIHKDFAVSISMGVSTTQDCGREYARLFYCADQAMYKSKRRGRGCYTIYSRDMSLEPEESVESFALGEEMLKQDIFLTLRTLLRTFSECMNDYLFVYDLTKDIFYISNIASRRFALPSSTFTNVAETLKTFVYEEDQPALLKELKEMTEGVRDAHNLSYRWLSRSRQPVWINCRGRVIRGRNDKPLFVVGCINEIGTRQLADNVSGLLGESAFEDIYDQKCRQGFKGYLLRVGVDEFREINEQYGDRCGDFILRSTALCMQKVISPSQQLFRLSGDEFIIVEYDRAQSKRAQELYSKIRASIDGLIQKMNYDVIFTISAGVVGAEALDGCNYNEAMKRAQFSLGRAKNLGRNQCYIFQHTDYEKALRKAMILQEMKRSIKNNFVGFDVYYQPIINAKTGELYAAEALMRYTRESGECISPVEFIPILEKSALIVPVGKWLIEKSVVLCQKFRKYHKDFKVSINLSAVQFQKSGIHRDLQDAMDRKGLEYSSCILEMTESQLMDNNQMIRRLWNHMGKKGFVIAVDDFGTGYSNFSNISAMNPNLIKLDRSFTLRALRSEFDYTLMKSIITLSHELGLEVCVEGVETKEEIAYIRKLQPDFLQGYYYGEPGPSESFLEQYKNKL